jgi:hypothetical protein
MTNTCRRTKPVEADYLRDENRRLPGLVLLMAYCRWPWLQPGRGDPMTAWTGCRPLHRRQVDPTLKSLALHQIADLVLTLAQTLHRSSARGADNVHCFPAASMPRISRLSKTACLTVKQAGLAHPRLGYYGVSIDERIILDLITPWPTCIPRWQIVMDQPVSKGPSRQAAAAQLVKTSTSSASKAIKSCRSSWRMGGLPVAVR